MMLIESILTQKATFPDVVLRTLCKRLVSVDVLTIIKGFDAIGSGSGSLKLLLLTFIGTALYKVETLDCSFGVLISVSISDSTFRKVF